MDSVSTCGLETLPELLEEVLYQAKPQMWFQHDDTTALMLLQPKRTMDQQRWILCLACRSPQLNSLRLFLLWRLILALMYETPVKSEDLDGQIVTVAGTFLTCIVSLYLADNPWCIIMKSVYNMGMLQ
ncbi:hypothetical protein PR048_018757 [Dryococelus australis]|uniref:Uncharacterized protein n=1 Tax=Dryococelus australis TaxID=614101 RepID=A0ABQ9HDC1_9NEOP|nr:hypothetical protein PR048_018757 [Dryococelus australis]